MLLVRYWVVLPSESGAISCSTHTYGKEKKGMKKWRLTGPEPATYRPIAKVVASIHFSIPLLSTNVGMLYPEPPLIIPHQLMINTRFLLYYD